MRTDSGSLGGAGGLRLFHQSWLPDGEPRAAVVVVHGVGEHSDRYRWVASELADRGYAVHAMDHRGHGRSQGPRELIDSVDDAVSDLDAFVSIVVAGIDTRPPLPVFMLGHSMGGMIAVRYALAHQARLAGLILSAPVAAVDFPSALAPIGRLLSRVAPRLPLIRLDAGLVSRDPAVVAAYRSDPLVHHGAVPARTAAEILDTVEAFPDQVAAITLPTLIVYGTADGLAPPRGSEMLARRLGSPDVTAHPFEGLYHEVLNEPERETVLADILSWLDERAPAAGAADGRSATAGNR